MVAWLGDEHHAGMTHAQVEERLHTDGLALLRQLYQDRLDLRASQERRLDQVLDADGVEHGTAEGGRERILATRFGEVIVTRIAYRGRGVSDLHPADAVREATAKTATSRKLSTRLSRGEKRARKRMAEVACVYDLTPTPRTVADILPADGQPRGKTRPAPTAHGKWLTASVTDDTARV